MERKKTKDFVWAEKLSKKSMLIEKDFKPIAKKLDAASRKHAEALLHESRRGR